MPFSHTFFPSFSLAKNPSDVISVYLLFVYFFPQIENPRGTTFFLDSYTSELTMCVL